MRQNFIYLLLVVSTSFSQAQTTESQCQKVGLKAEFGPVRSQGNMGWCYANAAADLLSHHYRQELNNRPISAAYIALKFNYSLWAQNFREGGLMYFASSNAMENGLCPRSYDDELMQKGNKKTLREKLQYILDLKDQIDKGEIKAVESALTETYRSGSILNRIQLYDLMTILALSNKNNVLGNIADALCGRERHQVSKVASREFSLKYTGTTRKSLIKEINTTLDHRIPVGIAYFADFFDAENAEPTNASRHMSVVVDREYNKSTNQCEYWIRNSWGSHCGGYKNPKMAERCKNGYVLVPEDILQKYIYGLSYLKN